MGGCRSDANTQSLSGRVPDIWLRSNEETSRDPAQNARPHPERQTAPRTPDRPGTCPRHTDRTQNAGPTRHGWA